MTKAQVRSRIRTRLRDTVSPYEYTDAIVDDFTTAALHEIEGAILEVDPGYFRTRAVVNGYTDALDPGTYEFYPLPKDFRALNWIQREDGNIHYKIWDSGAYNQEQARFAGIVRGTLTGLGDGQSYSIPLVGGVETATVFGSDRFRVIPPCLAAGPQYGIYYYRKLVLPEGENQILEIPDNFEEALALAVKYRCLKEDGDALADETFKDLYGVPGTSQIGEMNRAKKMQRGRSFTRLQVKGSM